MIGAITPKSVLLNLLLPYRLPLVLGNDLALAYVEQGRAKGKVIVKVR